MKRIIDGKKYDTETANLILDWDNGAAYSDFDYVNEELYRKRNGEFFLYLEGGPMTDYASHSANGWSGWGEQIMPISEFVAKAWLSARGTAEEYNAIFGEPEE